MRKTTYWTRLVYNGVVLGIWPAGALAFISAKYAPNIVVFLAILIFSWAIFMLAFVGLYHYVIVPRRRRR